MVKLLFVYHADPEDVCTQSGRPASIIGQLRRNGVAVSVLRIDTLIYSILLTVSRMSNWLGLSRVNEYRAHLPTMYAAWKIRQHLRRHNADVVFSASTIHFRWLRELRVRRVACVDTLVPGLYQLYRSRKSHECGDCLSERRALENCDVLLLPTEWAAKQVNELGPRRRPRLLVAPFGANLSAPLTRSRVAAMVERRKAFNSVNVVTITTDWERKGGPLLVQICSKLSRVLCRKITCVVIGPVVSSQASAFGEDVEMNFVGRLNKNVSEDAALFDRLMSDSHFFVMPSVGEAFGMALCEAAAYGIPAIASKNGGIAEILGPGVGFSMDGSTEAEIDRAVGVLASLANGRDYEVAAMAARDRYEKALNWDAFYLNALAPAIAE